MTSPDYRRIASDAFPSMPRRVGKSDGSKLVELWEAGESHLDDVGNRTDDATDKVRFSPKKLS